MPVKLSALTAKSITQLQTDIAGMSPTDPDKLAYETHLSERHARLAWSLADADKMQNGYASGPGSNPLGNPPPPPGL